MRILFSSLPSHGHTYPLIPLALAASDAGHEVLFATGESFHRSLEAFGLDAVVAGMPIFEAFAEANGGSLDRAAMTEQRRNELVAKVFGTVLPRVFARDLAPVLARIGPDLVVHEAGNPGAFIAAKRAGIPGICHGFGRVAPSGADDSMRDALVAVAREFGVEFPTGFARGGGDPYLDIYPASMQGEVFLETVPRIPLRPVPVSEPGNVPAVVTGRDQGRPLVYLTLGTAFGAIPVLRQAIEGLAALDTDVLVAAGPTIDVAALGEVPDNVKVEAWVPQAEVLPHVDLVVHHGGSGTTLGALANGLPQLILPQGADQFSNAEAVSMAGAGTQLLAADLAADAITIRAKHLLTDEAARAAAQAVAAEIAAMPSPAATVEVLTGLV